MSYRSRVKHESRKQREHSASRQRVNERRKPQTRGKSYSSDSDSDDQHHQQQHHVRGKRSRRTRNHSDSGDSSDSSSSKHRRQRHHHHQQQQHHKQGRTGEGRVRVKIEPPDDGYERSQQRQSRDSNDRRRIHEKRRKKADYLAGRGPPDDFAESSGTAAAAVPNNKEKPNFALSGKLTADTNTYKGVVIKYNQPPEARKPRKKWRLYPFKGEDALPMLPLHRHSAFLLGRDRLIADIPIDHPSCSKQHAVFQFRLVDHERRDGTSSRMVKPYIIDLGSTNGTYVNSKRIDPERYMELREQDVLKFGYSSREYVLLHEKSDTADVAGGDDGVASESD